MRARRRLRSGALTRALAPRLGASAVSAADPSAPFADARRERVPGAEVVVAGAEQLPFVDVIQTCLLGARSACSARIDQAERFVRRTLPGRPVRVYDAIRRRVGERAPQAARRARATRASVSSVPAASTRARTIARLRG